VARSLNPPPLISARPLAPLGSNLDQYLASLGRKLRFAPRGVGLFARALIAFVITVWMVAVQRG
jgi:hypothetical protein